MGKHAVPTWTRSSSFLSSRRCTWHLRPSVICKREETRGSGCGAFYLGVLCDHCPGQMFHVHHPLVQTLSLMVHFPLFCPKGGGGGGGMGGRWAQPPHEDRGHHSLGHPMTTLGRVLQLPVSRHLCMEYIGEEHRRA